MSVDSTTMTEQEIFQTCGKLPNSKDVKINLTYKFTYFSHEWHFEKTGLLRILNEYLVI